MPDYATCIWTDCGSNLQAICTNVALILIGHSPPLIEVSQKRQQLIVWLEPSDRGVHRRRFLKGAFLQRKIRVQIDLRGFN
jgi:hypothetical protein